VVHKPLKIFLGDLTYTTISLATDAFPLNVGYIASYCKSKFGNDVEIQVFKYIDDLDNALNSSPPDVLGLSNYAWNHNVSYEFFKLFKKLNSNGVTVWGGPNFPNDIESQTKFMNEFTDVDFYVPGEGEIGFSNIIKQLFETNYRIGEKRDLFSTHIEGCISKTLKNIIHYEPLSRTRLLDEVPSPYTSGFLDKFFDGKLSPMLQTNRGCPFACTFCTDGSSAVNQVNSFSLDRVKDELKYIGAHIPKNTHNMIISDLNFGMMPRDLEVCDLIAEIQQEYNYPQQIHATTGKNQKKRVIEAVKRNNGALRIYMSVQSMDEQVLKNIKRDNISVDQMLALAPTIKESNIRTSSEVILGLPGESYESHVRTLRDLVRAKLDHIEVHTCMMLNGAELNTPQQREKWEFQTKFRILPRDFGKLSNGRVVCEIEEVVVGSNTLTFEEYIELRCLAFVMFVTSIGIVYDPILKLLREYDYDVFDLFYLLHKRISEAPESIRSVYESVKNSSHDELWDSPKDIIDFYQSDENYQKLLDGRSGINVIQYHNALITSDMDQWTEYVISTAELIVSNRHDDREFHREFNDVCNYSRGLSYNILGKDRMDTNPDYKFYFNIDKWVSSSEKLPLNGFVYPKPQIQKFVLSEEQFQLVEDELSIYGDSPVGKGQSLKRIPIHKLWRHPENTSIIPQK
jgi:radical SAM superfamily enzyme YgiQ (UPF0313 family)